MKNKKNIYHYKLYITKGFYVLYDLKLKRRVCFSHGIRPIYYFILNNRINPDFIELIPDFKLLYDLKNERSLKNV